MFLGYIRLLRRSCLTPFPILGLSPFPSFPMASAVGDPRSYQLEMLEQSKKQNTIIAVSWFAISETFAEVSKMPTGSGKTSVSDTNLYCQCIPLTAASVLS